MKAERSALYRNPIKLRASPGVLAEAAACERGSWEDHGCPGDEPGNAHARVIFERRKTLVEILSPLEADHVIASLLNSEDLKVDAGFGRFDQECATAARHEIAFRRLRLLVVEEKKEREKEMSAQAERAE